MRRIGTEERSGVEARREATWNRGLNSFDGCAKKRQEEELRGGWNFDDGEFEFAEKTASGAVTLRSEWYLQRKSFRSGRDG